MVHLPFAPVIAGKNVYQLCTFCPRHSTGENKNKPYQTVGEIFDWYKAKEYEKLPANVKINSGRWKAQ
jgi:hypothetical protein